MKIAKEYGVSLSTVYARANGTKPKAETNEGHQGLSKYLAQFLEGYLIFLAQKNSLSQMTTRRLA